MDFTEIIALLNETIKLVPAVCAALKQLKKVVEWLKNTRSINAAWIVKGCSMYRKPPKWLERADKLKPGDVICVPSGMAVVKNVYETDSGIRIIFKTASGNGRRDVPRDKQGTVYRPDGPFVNGLLRKIQNPYG